MTGAVSPRTVSDTQTRTTRMQNRGQLRALRAAWLILFAFAAAVSAAALPVDYYRILHQTYPALLAQSGIDWLPPELPALLHSGLTFLMRLTGFGGALYLFWRRSDDWMALLTGVALIGIGVGLNYPAITLMPEFPWLLIPMRLLLIISTVGLFLFLCLFPDGRFVPRWVAFIVPLQALWEIMRAFTLTFMPTDTVERIPTLFVVSASFWVVGAAMQFYRFRRLPNGTQRQQIKWVAWACVILLPALLFIGIIRTFPPPQEGIAVFVRQMLTTVIFYSVPTVGAAAVTFSILRYRLYDVDVALNRTLVAALVTLAVGAAAVGGGMALNAIIHQPEISFVVAVGVGALIFQPARRAARRLIDRRVYGLRYDINAIRAAQTDPTIKKPGALTGAQLGKYVVRGVIGRGGMGEVYEGVAGDERVALKILPSESSEHPERLKRFQREAAALGRLQHPGIVRLHGAGVSGDIHYMALEYLAGQDLRAVSKARGQMPLEEAVPILQAVADALDYAHARGMIHRDLKPSNIMIVANGGSKPERVVLMDFGIAKFSDMQTQITQTDMIGTIDYMAPEQITASSEVDARADVYALGIIAYELLTGTRPFKGNAAQMVFAHLQKPPPDPRTLVPTLPESAAKAILKALAKDPQSRYPSPKAFVAALAKGLTVNGQP